MRKLASIQKILNIQPIPSADAIEVASILGWQVVIKKGDFQIGDLCIYVEIDALMPEKPEFEFLRKNHFRIKTVKLRGQISQGICFPLSILPQDTKVEEGMNVSDIIGAEKYEPAIPSSLSGLVKGRFPSYVPKTDEVRIQSEPGLIEEFKGKQCYISVKVDGTSGTFSHFNGEIDVCSRNMSFKESDSAYWKVFGKYDMENILKGVGNFAIQGEVIGPGIQKNRLNLKSVDLFVFSVYNIDARHYLDYKDFIGFCQKYSLRTTPIIRDDVIFDFTIEQLLEMAKGEYEGTNNNREGIVIRPVIETYSQILSGRLSVKVVNNEYLLKNEQ